MSKVSASTSVTANAPEDARPVEAASTSGCPAIAKVLGPASNDKAQPETTDNEPIPLVDLKANYRSIQGEIDLGITKVVGSCWFIGGPAVKGFQSEFSAYCGTSHCVGVNSGTDALFLALTHLGVGPGDEVILPANTFIATALAVSSAGAEVVLCDCESDSFLMDVTLLEGLVTSKTKAIIPVHLYGQCVDMDAVLSVAQAHNLMVVEDAAQAHGAMYKGKRAGSMGHAGCFSFYPGKNLGAFGDGGAIVTNDSALAERIGFWQNWGAAKKYHHVVKGGNSRLDAIQAAVLSAKLTHLDQWNANRRQRATDYIVALTGVGDLKLPERPSDATSHVWHLFVVKTSKRDALVAFLNKHGIGAGIHYPVALPQLDAYKNELESFLPAVPHALDNADLILSLPMFPELTSVQLNRVCALVRQFFAQQE